MKLDEFLTRLPTLMLNDLDDERFITLKILTQGMTSPRIAKLIYYACKFLHHEKEVYVEHGTWTGYTLISAGYETDDLVIGIDPYELEFDTEGKVSAEAKNLMVENMRRFHPHALVIEKDFRDVVWERKESIGVFFVDADHTYDDVLASLEWGYPYLSDEAILIFDDIRTSGPGEKRTVWEAISHTINKNPEFTLEAMIQGGLAQDTYSHNGFAIISFRRNHGK